jgi:uncharacterized Zn-finger protein
MCGVRFSRHHNFIRHLETSHFQKASICNVCHKTFSRIDSLRRHQLKCCTAWPSRERE